MTPLPPILPPVLSDATIPELPNHYRGKVRDNYDLPDGSRILIATDRLSAFDIILASIPAKGQVLTATARWWFERTADIVPNWARAYPDPNAVLGQRLAILPVEMVVRGYLAGTTGTSILTQYKVGARTLYGHRLPDGMRDNQQLATPLITPTSKAMDGAHDAPLTQDDILQAGLVTPAQWDEVCALSLALYARGTALAAGRGLILADTKYEFGTDADGRIALADEIHTPDSSRYWKAASFPARFESGEKPESFDKDFVRSWSPPAATPTPTRSPRSPPNSSTPPPASTSRPTRPSPATPSSRLPNPRSTASAANLAPWFQT